MRLDPQQTFSSLIRSALLTSAIRRVRRAVAASAWPRPLAICGPSGMGKTHVLHAAANELLWRAPTANVKLVTAEEFFNGYVESIRLGTTCRHRDSLLRCDGLFVDGLEYLAGRPATQEFLTGITRHVIGSGRPVIMTTLVRLPMLDEIDKVTLRPTTLAQRVIAVRRSPLARGVSNRRVRDFARAAATIPGARGACDRASMAEAALAA